MSYQASQPRRFVTRNLEYHNPYFQRESPEQKNHRHKRLRYWIVAVVIIAVAYIVVYSSIFRVSELDVTGPNTAHSGLLQQEADEYLSSRIWGVLPQDNSLWLSADVMESALIEAAADTVALESLVVVKDFPKKITVEYIERTAKIIVMNEERLFSVDSQGVVISEYAPPVFVNNDENVPAPDGASTDTQQDNTEPEYPVLVADIEEVLIAHQVVPPALVQAIIDLEDRFPSRFSEFSIDQYSTIDRPCEEFVLEDETVDEENNENNSLNSNSETTNANVNTNLNINTNSTKNINSANTNTQERIVVPCPEPILNEFALRLKEGPEIYFSTDAAIEIQLNSLYLTINETIKNGLSGLEYIDLRYLNRVYYK
ncbi:MAG: hypothetical protein Q8Q20_05710 [bacterium]|nr:hypothetical protein [bacterium]